MTAQETKVVNGIKSTLASTMAAGATSFQVASAAGFPAVPFYVCIDPLDPAKREYMLVDDEISGTTLTLSDVSQRNLAGSAGAVEHASGAEVRVSPPMAQLFEDIHDRVDAHLADTADAHDASAISYAGGTGMSATDVEAAIDELATEKSNTTHTHDSAWSKTVAVQGEVKVPSGAVDYLVPFTVHVESGETLTITKVYDAVRSGTSVTYKLTKNGVDEITGLSATTTHNSTDTADFTVVDGDRLAVVVTAVSGTPDGLEVTICGTTSSID
jgi:hypothetical protein